MAPFQHLIVEKQAGGLDILTLNRPERMNAISMPMCQELTDYFAGLRDDYRTRVVIMRGAGKGFCGGLDLVQQSDLTPSGGQAAEDVHPSEKEVSKTLKGQPCVWDSCRPELATRRKPKDGEVGLRDREHTSRCGETCGVQRRPPGRMLPSIQMWMSRCGVAVSEGGSRPSPDPHDDSAPRDVYT